jgi:tRNA (guanosine-2'-O-)-methyltransferase
MTARGAEEFLLEDRRARIEQVVRRRTRSLVVVLEDLEDPHNMCAVLRTCEGFGIQEVHAVAKRFEFHANSKITQGAEKWLDVEVYRDTSACLAGLKDRGFLICATRLGPGSSSLLDLPTGRPIALVFGNETDGVSDEALSRSDVQLQIPMQGFSQSLNVSVSVAVCVSHVIFQRIRNLGSAGDLDARAQDELRGRFFALAVKQRRRLFSPEALGNTPQRRASKRPRRSP